MLPNKKYNIIYADPPWSYNDKCNAGKRGAEFKYPVMSYDDIQTLRVDKIADENCYVFMWCTFPLLHVGLHTLHAWGFEYKTVGFNWVKMNKKKPTPFWGMGSYTRSNSEACLLGVKGKLKRQSASVHSVVMSPIREHSRKPDEVRDKIVELYGDLPRIELFAREEVEGWDSWGNEVGKF